MGRLGKRQRHLAVARSKRQAVQQIALAPDEAQAVHDPTQLGVNEDEDCEVFTIPDEQVDDDIVDDVLNRTLRWIDSACPKRVAVNLGTSRRTEFRRKKEKAQRVDSAKGCLPISKYFAPAKVPGAENGRDAVAVPELRISNMQELVEKALEVLMPLSNLTSNRRAENRSKQISKYEFVRLRAVRRYFELIVKSPNSKMESSMQIAQQIYPENNREWRARSIREWGSYYLIHHALPPLNQGKHQNVTSFIDCEDVQIACLRWIRTINPNMLHGRSFSEWVTSQLHLILEYPNPIQLGSRQATVWLQKLGFQYQQHRQNHNVDGHEREDVVKYRQKFLERMFEFEKKMQVHR